MNPSEHALALWPPAASVSATETDIIILLFTIVTLFLTVPIFVGITYFAIRYRSGRLVDRSFSEARSNLIELSWMIIPFVLTLIFFGWAASLFDQHKHPPANAMQVSAIARQWMWKFQHPGGQAEINDLHLPIGQPIEIRMISQDVIHGLYIPALRIQMETLPDRYTNIWFNANRTGTYHLFCSEYCGTDHSVMDGWLTLMTPADYERWLAQAGSDRSLAEGGKRLFTSYGCAGCHGANSTVHAPSLAGLYGKPVPMQAGGTVIADDSYLRDKILNPDHNLIAGYQQVMPSFKGVIQEDDLVRLIAFLKSQSQNTEAAK